MGKPFHRTESLCRRLKPLLAAAGARQAYLFGSYARGEADDASDVDVAIIADTTEPFVDRFRQFARVLDAVPESELLVYTPAEWAGMRAERASFYLEIIERGIPLLGGHS